MTMQDIMIFLDKKITKNQNEVVIRFYEVRIKMNLSGDDLDIFLRLCKSILESLGYHVYCTGTKYIYRNTKRIVEANELIVAVKE